MTAIKKMIKFVSAAAVAAAVGIASQAQDAPRVSVGNFGLPGLIDLPSARALPDGELVLTQQLHRSLARSGMSFQLLPNLGVAFRYSSQGPKGGEFAVYSTGRNNHDRSFDAHVNLFEEGRYHPGVAIGLRDFIGTGWYSSEYVVATKSIGALEITGGLGFGRLAGRDSFGNPLGAISTRFKLREAKDYGRGGTFGTINWFQGNASAFGGISYQVGHKANLTVEYSPDSMAREARWLGEVIPWNFGASYRVNNTLSLAAQYLHGSTLSVMANIALNPKRPPNDAGRETAPVPVRARGVGAAPVTRTDEATIRKVLAVEEFEVINFMDGGDYVRLDLKNTKYRSVAQALGRAAVTLQRFTSDATTRAVVVFHEKGLQAASYTVDLDRVTQEQLGVAATLPPAIIAEDAEKLNEPNVSGKKFNWGLGPYITHRLFNPDLPLSAELGLELSANYRITPKLSLDGAVRKSMLTNLTENKRLGKTSTVQIVQSDWGQYDINGQPGYIHQLSLNYNDALAPGIFARAHAGLLEPFWAGLGGELLYMPVNSFFGLGVDLHRVRKRDYEMRLDLQNYETTTGHVSAYLDAGGMFDLEINAGRYLAGDWGATTRLSRQFANGWEVGGYATLTDDLFEDFGEG